MRHIIISILLAETLLLMGAMQAPKQTQQELDAQLIHSLNGPDLYRAYCASCHGIDARGNGPAAPALKAKVPDLTSIAQRNHGVFPSARVSKIISGEETPAAHGSREMPIWGPIFHQVERDQDWGNVRLQNLSRFLESIQKK
jgi:mono/diheme cytochrome c family protein